MSFKLIHICEVCGKKEILTPEEAYEKGWDYPPKIGFYGIVSPRTCGDCSVIDTLWWAIRKNNLRIPQDLDEHQREVLDRILGEPASILPDP